MEKDIYYTKDELANLLLLYLKQNNLYDYSIGKTHVREVVVDLGRPIDVGGAFYEYDVTYNQTITVNDTAYIKSKEKVMRFHDYPESAVLSDGKMSGYDFDEELKNNKEFLETIMKINNITPLELMRNASSIYNKQKIALLDKQIADLEEQIHHHKLKAKLSELIDEREKLMGQSYTGDENYENLDDSVKKIF